jgi:hypothetical protein
MRHDRDLSFARLQARQLDDDVAKSAGRREEREPSVHAGRRRPVTPQIHHDVRLEQAMHECPERLRTAHAHVEQPAQSIVGRPDMATQAIPGRVRGVRDRRGRDEREHEHDKQSCWRARDAPVKGCHGRWDWQGTRQRRESGATSESIAFGWKSGTMTVLPETEKDTDSWCDFSVTTKRS